MNPHRTSRLAFALVSVAVVGAAAAATASADPSLEDLPTVHLKYDPASLASDAGARVLYSRIVQASVAVCPRTTGRDLTLIDRIERCRRDAIAGAVRQVDDTRLAAVSARHGHAS